MRLVFSYFAHPMKAYAKKVGRSLTLLSKKAQALLPTFEMQNISDIVTWARHTDRALQQRVALKGCRQRERDVQLWELDVKEMFPRLSRGDPSFEPILGPVVASDPPEHPGVIVCCSAGSGAHPFMYRGTVVWPGTRRGV